MADLSYRGRPYTKRLPFAQTTVGAVPHTIELWSPHNLYFEVGMLLAKSTVAVDLNICDGDANNVIGFLGLDGVNYSRFDPGLAAIRSQKLGSKLLLVDPTGVVFSIKGIALGWEVDRDGGYS